MDKTEVTYVANAGVLLILEDKKILIDALCNSRLPVYKNIPSDIYNQIIKGTAPYDNIDLMLITHKHSDHYDRDMVSEFLEHNNNTIVISTDDVISELKTDNPENRQHRLVAVSPPLYGKERITVKGINIEAVSMTHDGKEFFDVNNLAFIIEYGKTLMHIGDAAPTKVNYQSLVLTQKKCDLLIANFPYVGLPSARQLVKEYINPKQIAAVHLPVKEQDSFGWIHSTKKSYERVKESFYPTEFLEEIGSSFNLS